MAFAAILVRNYFPHTYLMGDSPYYAAAAASLVADGDLKVENNLRGDLQRHSSFVSLGADGEWRPKHPVLMSVASVPFLMMFGVVGLLVFNVVVMALLVMASGLYRIVARRLSVGRSGTGFSMNALSPYRFPGVVFFLPTRARRWVCPSCPLRG